VFIIKKGHDLLGIVVDSFRISRHWEGYSVVRGRSLATPRHRRPLEESVTRESRLLLPVEVAANSQLLFKEVWVLSGPFQVVAINWTPTLSGRVKCLHNRGVCQPKMHTAAIPFPVPEPER